MIMKEKTRGSLVVISGPSGCGKGTVISKYMENNDHTWVSISYTSRKRRPDEVEGVSYYFISKEEFEDKIKKGCVLEYNCYNGNYYGTPKEKIEDHLQNGEDVILEIDVNGAKKVKELMSECICIFIMPPSMQELKKRLVARKTDDFEKVLERFKLAYQEINQLKSYNYVVVNDEVDNAVMKVRAILVSEKCRVDRIEEMYLNNEEEEIHELLMEKDFINKDIEID